MKHLSLGKKNKKQKQTPISKLLRAAAHHCLGEQNNIATVYLISWSRTLNKENLKFYDITKIEGLLSVTR